MNDINQDINDLVNMNDSVFSLDIIFGEINDAPTPKQNSMY